jgi:paraquat-inducible protein B
MSDSLKNQAVIGAFVVGAVLLAVVGVIIFGSGKWFQEVNRYVMFFEGSVKGLSIGAPVTFRGVRIGSVVDITLRADPVDLKFRIPVVIEVEEGKVERSEEIKESDREAVNRLIDSGLRARLDVQSLVTGQLLVNLEILPDEPERISGIDHKYQEIPTIPSSFERITKTIQDLPIREMMNKASASLTALEAVLKNPALMDGVNYFEKTMANAELLTRDLNQRVTPLMETFQQVADHTDQLILNVNDEIKPLVGDARQSLRSVNVAAGRIRHAADTVAGLSAAAQPAVANLDQAVANIANLTNANSKERQEMRNMLKELAEAARSIRVWSSYLERHPEAIIYGKGQSKRR